MFARVAVLGTGLIGGSFALAMRRHSPHVSIAGFDRPEVLAFARERGVIHAAHTELAAALRGAELVYIALPLGAALDLLPAVARHAEPRALVTDACGLKAQMCHRAAEHFRGGARFLGGHPMAGKESRGIEHADAQLFSGAAYALVAEEGDADPRFTNFVALLRAIGARPLFLDAERHDWAVTFASHLPQMLALALAQVLRDETDETGLPLALAGPGARDALRLAGSPYDLWRDLCLANRENLRRALDRLAQALEHLRENLASRELEELFAGANQVYQKLREVK